MATNPHVEEDVPGWPELRAGEQKFGSRNNTLIIMGRDRPADKDSGYGNEPGAGTIHHIVGRTNPDPDFASDLAFTYLAMKTDVDENLGLQDMVDGEGTDLGAISGPAAIVKSDTIRIVHREAGDIRISSEDGSNFILLNSERCEIKLGASWLRIEDGNIIVESGLIKLGVNAETEHVIRGDTFIEEYLQHTHQSPTGPTSMPIPMTVEKATSGEVLAKPPWVEAEVVVE